MFKAKHTLKALGAAALLGLSSLSLAAPATAQASSLRSILADVREDASRLGADGDTRLREFRQAAGEQRAEFERATSELRALEGRGQALANQVQNNDVIIGELDDEIKTLSGEFYDLLGQFRTAAGETMPVIAKSLSNFDDSANLTGGADRVAKLAEISEAEALPYPEDLRALPEAIIREMAAQSEVKTFRAEVTLPDGSKPETELLRIGVFSAATTDGTQFVEVREPLEGDNFLQTYLAQPRGATRSSMARLIAADSGVLVKAPVDPSKGTLFGIEGELPGTAERIEQGGLVGTVILTLLAIGAALALFKIVSLVLMAMAMGKTAKTREAGDGDPLARVLEVYEEHKSGDLETLELKLDEQILKDAPKIERFNDIIKVLSAVAPLLGLLGTVIGMIITFTSITIYGAGDPKLMAGGISTALMTTVLGLVAAIPLLLLHAVTSSLARGNQQVLDEQAAGIVAERSEKDGAVAA